MLKRIIRCIVICFVFMLLFGVSYGSGNNHIISETEDSTQKEEYVLLENLEQEGKVLTLFKRICLAENGFATSAINVSKFRTSAVISTEYGQLIAYFKANGSAYLTLLQGNKVCEIEIVDDMQPRLLGDGHCSISIGYHKGRVWYAYGAHCCKGWWGVVPIESFGDITRIYAKESVMAFSYPQFYNANDKLYFVCRNEDDYWTCQKLTEDSVLNFESVILYGKRGEILYINDLGISQNGRYAAIPFVERKPMKGSHVRNDGIYLIWSDDFMQTWSSTKTDQLTSPIEFQDTSKILILGADENLMNQESTYVSDTGEIFFSYMCDDASGIPQIYLGKFSIATEKTQSWQVTDNHEDFDLLGKGTLWLPLSRAQVIGSDNYIHIICRVGENIHIFSCKRNATDFGQAFNDFCIEGKSVGAWEPNYDAELWREEHILCLFVQDTLQGTDDILGIKTKISPIHLYYFKEK